MAKQTRAEFIQWMPHVLEALRALGGSAPPREVYDKVAALAKVPDEKRFAKLSSGPLRFPNQVAWAKQYLVWEHLVSSAKRGIWMLTAEGADTRLSEEQASAILFKWAAIHAQKKKTEPDTTPPIKDEPTDEGLEPASDYRSEVLSLLQNFEPSAFERFCAALLRHLGMVGVKEIGGSGDKGIDGIGYLPMGIGSIITTKIAFQCKRYNDNGGVTPAQVREFRGAIGHRAEKGIIFTTGYFTKEAKAAAGDDMATPIELVDGERLVELLAVNQFGLLEAKTYELDHEILGNYVTHNAKPKPTK